MLPVGMLTMFLWKATHLRMYQQHKLDLMGSKKKEGLKLGLGGARDRLNMIKMHNLKFSKN